MEQEHKGKFVAIGPDGQTIFGKSMMEVFPKSVEKFGSGKFALARIGRDALGRWLTVTT